MNRKYDLEERLIDFVLKIIIKKLLPENQIVASVLLENEELIAIFAQSVKTAKLKL